MNRPAIPLATPKAGIVSVRRGGSLRKVSKWFVAILKVKRGHMQIPRLLVILMILGLGLFAGGRLVRPAEAQTPPRQSQGASGEDIRAYDLQRSIQMDSYKLVAKSGAARGETLYFYKCWACHNQYTIQSEYGDKAPFLRLKNLYARPKLVSGDPVTDETVTNKIKKGGPRMPSFGATMTDSDIADLVSYLRGGKCCLEGEDPPANPWYRASAQKWTVPNSVSGGARGLVRSASGEPLEGMMVQLIAPSAVRTTVYTNEEGQYEFPQMQPGVYTLRIAKPLEFFPYQRDSVQIRGAAKLEDIVLERRADPETHILVGESGLPPTPEVSSQLTGAEWLWNLPGTAQEKEVFHRACGSGCHDYQRIFRNRFDERSWRLMVGRMIHYSSRSLINRSEGVSTRGNPEQEDMLVKWLARVRGPESQDVPLRVFPRPRRAATRVIVTEYELPRALLSPHDVAGDSKGNIWYTSHKTPYVGRLDPRTGIVKEYRIPLIPGALPGTHRVAVDKYDTVWFSENWASKLTKFDPQTEQFTQMHVEREAPINNAGFSNFGVAPDGSIWNVSKRAVVRMDPRTTGTAEVVQRWPLEKEPSSYDNMISNDGNFWAGGGPASGGHAIKLLDIRTGKVLILETSRQSSPARGGFDPEGNPWFGGRGGSILTLNVKARRIREYWPPSPYTPYTAFYEAMPDKNGEVWAGILHGGGFLRLNPRTEQWTEYVLPEPYANDYRTWIDNSTNPISVWYVDYMGYIVRIQPLE